MANTQTLANGLPAQALDPMIDHLNTTLADLQLFYQNLRGIHWNITGEHFFVLHTQFEALYDEVAEHVDMTAERIRSLDATPLHTFEQYLTNSDIDSAQDVTTGPAAIALVVDNLTKVIAELRELVAAAANAGDPNTEDMGIEMLRAYEKHLWMYRAWKA